MSRLDGRARNGRARLTEADIEAIRGHYRAGVPATTIASLWGVHRTRVYQLLDGLPRLHPKRRKP